jgi:hypothetical protein
MAQAGPVTSRGARPDADSDVYTVLMLIAFLFVLTATIYVGYRAVELFGTILPPPGG